MQAQKLNSIGHQLLDDLIKNERGNYNGEDVINALLKKSGGAAGKRVRERREELKIGQADLQAVLECAQSEVTKIEKGERALSVEDAQKLATLLKVAPEWILTGR